ncbi:hypothetical protein PIB30_030146, partial [Stylosanthes scabra]|nr:hypothetical protein [Stylosanthes scabra]
MAAFFPSPQLHHQNLHFLFIPAPTFLSSLPSSSTSSSFPLTIKCSSSSISRTHQFHVVSDSIHNNVIQDLEESLTNSHSHLNGVPQFDPPWISSIFLKGLCKNTNLEFKLLFNEIEKNKYNLLRRRQIQAETEAWERMVEEYRELERVMRQKNLAPNLPHVKALFLGWFEPLKEAIEAEQKSQKSRKHRMAFAPHIESLPAAKMAVIVMHKMMGLVAMEHHQAGCVVLVNAAVQIGMAIEQEVKVQKFMEKTRSRQRKKTEADTEDDLTDDDDDKPKLVKHINGLIKKRRLRAVQKLLKKEDFVPWGRDVHAKLGSRLIDMLIGTAYVHIPVSQSADTPPDFRPAFRHRFKAISRNPGEKILKNYGVIECDPLVLAGLDKSANHMLMPYMPMLIPPKKWKGYE